jgi:hypothetical protein
MSTATMSATKGPPTENVLLAYVEQLADKRAGCRALCFHLSRLSASHRGEKYVQAAANLLMEVVHRFSGRLFLMRGADIVVICKGITAKAIEETVDAVRYLFIGDGLAEAEAVADFCSVFDLEIGYAQFRSTIRRIHDTETRNLEREARARAPTPAKSLHIRIGEIIDSINGLDLSQAVQRQTVWAIYPGKKPQPKFDELFMSIDRLQKMLDGGFDLRKDKQLFQYLTQSLDKYLLTRLVWEQVGVARPVSININIATLHTPEFLKFESERERGLRGRTILELQMADLWADIAVYEAIADVVKQRGYLRCLDGVKYQALPCLNFQHLKIDLVKLVWDEALLRLDQSALRTLGKAIAECGPRRIVLTRCGRPEAIRFGHAVGIHLFQGWHLDRMIALD